VNQSKTYEDCLGGSITILEEGSDTTPMRFRMVMPPGFGPPAPECHPYMREDFRILRGKLSLGKVDGTPLVLSEGETCRLPAGVFHKPANAGDEPVEFEATLTPGRDAAAMFTELYEVSRTKTGFRRNACMAAVFGRYPETISFPAPVRLGMRLVAWLAGGSLRHAPPVPEGR
jgi:mannose-6-phosphate isomerase-like protein (cupin superfamily)